MRNAKSAYAALACAGLLWGLGFPLGKTALTHMPVGAMITFRFAIAGLVLLPVLFNPLVRELLQPRRLLQLTIAGALYVPVQFVVQFEGLARTSVSHASLMVALLPGMIAIASALVLRRSLSKPVWAAIALSVAGAALVAGGNGRGASIAGDALVLLSLFAAIAWILFTERFLADVPAAPATALMLIIGTALLAAVEIPAHVHDFARAYPAQTWAAVAVSGVFCTALTTVLWNAALRRVDASRAGVFINMEPIAGSFCGVLFFGDTFGLPLVTGAALVLAGAFFVTLQRPTEEPPALREAA